MPIGRVLAVTLAFVGVAATANGPSDLLKRALGAQRSTYATLVQTRGGPGGMPSILVKVQVAPSKGMKVTILQPVSWQGSVSIDDGRTLRSFSPDEDIIVQRPSPLLFAASTDWRVRRAQSSYEMVSTTGVNIAGRPTMLLKMSPKADEMPKRRLWLDTAKNLLLRYEIETEEGEWRTYIDTKSVEYGKEEALKDFNLPSSTEVRVSHESGPTNFKKSSDTVGPAGFAARIPSELPFGYQVYARHILSREDKKYVAVRISDGMSSISVYQWLESRFGKEPPTRSRRTVTDGHGVRFSLDLPPGDYLPDDVRRKILAVFVEKV